MDAAALDDDDDDEEEGVVMTPLLPTPLAPRSFGAGEGEEKARYGGGLPAAAAVDDDEEETTLRLPEPMASGEPGKRAAASRQ